MCEMIRKIEVPAIVSELDAVQTFTKKILQEARFSEKSIKQVAVAVEEVFVNIAHYAYTPGTGEAAVQIEINKKPEQAVITFTDRGKPFNPMAKAEPDVSLPAKDRGVGGLGIFMARRLMDDMSYEYKEGRNVLRMVKEKQEQLPENSRKAQK